MPKRKGNQEACVAPMTRDTMLGLARTAILTRAAADGYTVSEYDPVTDEEGYVTSLLTALRHWCHVHGLDWGTELKRAEQFFHTDLREQGKAS